MTFNVNLTGHWWLQLQWGWTSSVFWSWAENENEKDLQKQLSGQRLIRLSLLFQRGKGKSHRARWYWWWKSKLAQLTLHICWLIPENRSRYTAAAHYFRELTDTLALLLLCCKVSLVRSQGNFRHWTKYQCVKGLIYLIQTLGERKGET